jgi:hypothetical protein
MGLHSAIVCYYSHEELILVIFRIKIFPLSFGLIEKRIMATELIALQCWKESTVLSGKSRLLSICE